MSKRKSDASDYAYFSSHDPRSWSFKDAFKEYRALKRYKSQHGALDSFKDYITRFNEPTTNRWLENWKSYCSKLECENKMPLGDKSNQIVNKEIGTIHFQPKINKINYTTNIYRSKKNMQPASTSSSNNSTENSVDRHPTSTVYYNCLHGLGYMSTSDIHDNWLINGNCNLLKKLVRIRNDTFKMALKLENISDVRILTLSFIFVIAPTVSLSITQLFKHKHQEILDSLPKFNLIPIPDYAALWASRLYNSLGNSKKEINNTLIKIREEANDSPDAHAQAHCNIISYFFNYIKAPAPDRSEQDHADYLNYFLNEIFNDDTKYKTNTVSKGLVENSGYIPDYKIAYERKYNKVYDIFVVEIKKDDNKYTPNKSDYIKINLEMGIMLDALVKANVKDAASFGLLVKKFDCYLMKMTIDHNGAYFTQVIKEFTLPYQKYHLPLVPPVTAITLSLRQELDLLIFNIQRKKIGVSEKVVYLKPHFDMPCAVKDKKTVAYYTLEE